MNRYGDMSGSLMDNWPSDPKSVLQRRVKRKKMVVKRKPTVRVCGFVWCRVCGEVHERRSQMEECSQSEWSTLWREKLR